MCLLFFSFFSEINKSWKRTNACVKTQNERWAFWNFIHEQSNSITDRVKHVLDIGYVCFVGLWRIRCALASIKPFHQFESHTHSERKRKRKLFYGRTKMLNNPGCYDEHLTYSSVLFPQCELQSPDVSIHLKSILWSRRTDIALSLSLNFSHFLDSNNQFAWIFTHCLWSCFKYCHRSSFSSHKFSKNMKN